MRKLKKGDEIIVIAGKDKNKRGAISSVVNDSRVIVDGVNIAHIHQKPNPNAGIPGGIVDKARPLDISNVAIYNSATKSADRVGFKFTDDGKKIRIFKSTGEAIDV
ncbi:MAG: 50S ribosomal protein L24 [Gammaproteobacteria bacterium]|nr:50S ribosomal protein L24 [Gammaproteobacteria bacterium]